jgi:hypothetical protein
VHIGKVDGLHPKREKIAFCHACSPFYDANPQALQIMMIFIFATGLIHMSGWKQIANDQSKEARKLVGVKATCACKGGLIEKALGFLTKFQIR